MLPAGRTPAGHVAFAPVHLAPLDCRTEMTQLDHGDYNPAARTLHIRQGKGGKSRLLPVGERAAAWLDRFLADSRPLFNHLPQETAMFLTGYGTRITPAYLGTWVAGQMKLAGVTISGSCHLFRHSCATAMHTGGADIRYVQEMLGHARLETTQIYTHVHIAALTEVHARCHPHGRLPAAVAEPASTGPNPETIPPNPAVPVPEPIPEPATAPVKESVTESVAVAFGQFSGQLSASLPPLVALSALPPMPIAPPPLQPVPAPDARRPRGPSDDGPDAPSAPVPAKPGPTPPTPENRRNPLPSNPLQPSGDSARTDHIAVYAGRRETMTTYGTEEATTTWIYSPTRGFLTGKQYQGGNGTDYTYTPAGRLKTRTWERGVTTTYYHDAGGRQRAIDYSDSTPDVIFSLDALGRIVSEAQGTLAITDGVPSMASPIRSIAHTQDPATLLPASETHLLGGLTRTLVRTHDSSGRPQVVAAGINTDSDPATLETTEHFTEYFFGADGRLLGIDAKDLPQLSGKDYGIQYAYAADSPNLLRTLTRAGSGSAANLVTTNGWDDTRDALLTKDNRLDGAQDPVSRYTYTVNSLGQRETLATAGTAFGVKPAWSWGYNARGELVSASDSSANDRHLGYLFDAIGNRTATGKVYSMVDGVEQVTNPLTYSPNALNQYTVAAGVTLPSTPVPAPYDLDGNLRFDGGVNKDSQTRQYVWDAENRLIEVLDTSGQSAVPLVTNAYDSQSRRIRRTDEVAGTTTWYLYDGWNVVAEYTGATPALARTYTWGPDLSGSLQGAGGVGGLLAVRFDGANYYSTFDGNGNVSEYLTTAGVVAAHFEYDPFGNLTVFTEQSSGLAGKFTYRFSTKPRDSITGWFYYGYRYYDPLTGRWLNRDPIGENGGLNLYGFVLNDTANLIDSLGEKWFWSESGGCVTVRIEMKLVMLGDPNREKIRRDFRGRHPNITDEQIESLVDGSLSHYQSIRDQINSGTDSLASALESQLNEVYSGSECCCVKFKVKLRLTPNEKYIDKDDIGLRITADKGKAGESGGNGVLSGVIEMASGGLTNGVSFPHEIGHKMGLLHRSYHDLSAKDRESLNKQGLSNESISTLTKNNIGVIPIAQLGYDHNNSIIGLDPETNIMGYHDGKRATCEQLKSMLKSVKAMATKE